METNGNNRNLWTPMDTTSPSHLDTSGLRAGKEAASRAPCPIKDVFAIKDNYQSAVLFGETGFIIFAIFAIRDIFAIKQYNYSNDVLFGETGFIIFAIRDIFAIKQYNYQNAVLFGRNGLVSPEPT